MNTKKLKLMRYTLIACVLITVALVAVVIYKAKTSQPYEQQTSSEGHSYTVKVEPLSYDILSAESTPVNFSARITEGNMAMVGYSVDFRFRALNGDTIKTSVGFTDAQGIAHAEVALSDRLDSIELDVRDSRGQSLAIDTSKPFYSVKYYRLGKAFKSSRLTQQSDSFSFPGSNTFIGLTLLFFFATLVVASAYRLSVMRRTASK